MTDRAYIVSRTLENKIAIAENNDQNTLLVTLDVLKTILDLLKEQETVKPERQYSGGGITWWYVCGSCKTAINPNDKYCHECGKEVKWE